LFNLCLTLLLIGLFWLPVKLAQLEKFFNSPSIDVPQKVEMAQSEESAAMESPVPAADLLETRVITINASSEKNWAYFDFSRDKVVDIMDPSSLEWDLAFRRGKIITNGGVTNKIGKAGVIDLGIQDWDTVIQAPTENYVQDVTTRTESENPMLLKWYKYNYLTHKLSAKNNVYALRTADGKYAKVKFLSFYCPDNENAGCIKMQYVYQDNGSPRFTKDSGEFSTTSVAANPDNKEL
ncbi:MAG: hypothetical protein GWM98_02950, partial [Nitrospinaceae bacterium]|nr:hypothetical protein [Nitrospinaceae bacterium]NIR53655.1 hypothetical protein [Nitrospinaceae bacterium]NIS84061.1 hypothetical protein [Nitrospinaceae bacterium]NIT80862.1 hypothetical protein [Nitrospinaceae bacterium]NIU43171.1 hypothetical protein [Nitrospinaceae bacterium]